MRRRLAEGLRHRGLGNARLLKGRELAVERPVVGPAGLVRNVPVLLDSRGPPGVVPVGWEVRRSSADPLLLGARGALREGRVCATRLAERPDAALARGGVEVERGEGGRHPALLVAGTLADRALVLLLVATSSGAVAVAPVFVGRQLRLARRPLTRDHLGVAMLVHGEVQTVGHDSLPHHLVGARGALEKLDRRRGGLLVVGDQHKDQDRGP
mmetsp:Transcript_39075/g.92443  ORF Transcript_39075/g.92443 Transcript_39075/m.92443 type:complete len:212 (-) Transcript_39075:45-680(-)